MGMQTDVRNAYIDSQGGAAGVGPCRIKAIQYIAKSTSGSIVVADGDGGTTRLQIDTPTTSTSEYMLFPGEGVRFINDPYFNLVNVAAVTFFYG
jgi:hypothetical protein